MRLLLLILAIVAPAVRAQTDADIRNILAERVDKQRQSIGIVAGVIDAAGKRVVSHGKLAGDDPRAIAGDTVFEIGSITKVFTALLLADAVKRGEVVLSDPASKYLPESVSVPARGGRKITLEDLATHTSGLPRLPANLRMTDRANPYADYTVRQLHEFLSSHELARDIGTTYEYSNLGAGLLGHLLAARAGTDYETLVRKRVLAPLGMNSTAIVLTDDMKRRLAPGHDPSLSRVPPWDLPTLAGAGALRSTVDDMLTFLSAALGYTKTPLAPAMESMLAIRRPTGAPNVGVALGWHVTRRGDKEIVWHNGGTGGHRSFVGFDPKRRIGVVVLSNTSTAIVDAIGMQLLDARTQVAVDPKLYDRYVGRYELAPNFVLTVTREENRLYVQATGQPKLEIFPESERRFFWKAVDAQITFEEGRAILHQNGRDVPGKRVE